MGLTVLSVGYPLTEVGEDAVGGSEQILTLLDRALVEAGHRSVVVAAEGSKVEGTLIPSPRVREKLHDSLRPWAQKIHKKLIAEALASFDVDLVHFHSLDFHAYLPPPGTPSLATLHLPPDWYPPKVFRMKRRDFHLNCVSYSQQRACPRTCKLSVVPNGIEVSRLAARVPKRNYALALGRVCPEKAFHLAIDAAKRAGVDFMLAGEVFSYTSHRKYFKNRIAPRLDRRRRFIGPVHFTRKKFLLNEARCLLVTSNVAETSSLVSMEALAAGTPVIAFPSGALPEIVEHGRTGYIVRNSREMADAIEVADRIDPEECRREARRRFSSELMIGRYMHLYRNILSERAVEPEREYMVPGRSSWLMSW
jgi:glycosyltransferase involved in cell wall biosynthesis